MHLVFFLLTPCRYLLFKYSLWSFSFPETVETTEQKSVKTEVKPATTTSQGNTII